MKERILVLEDDRSSRMLLVKILEKEGYDVLECSEGRDAIHIALMYPPKVIIVDVMLPDMSGTEVVKDLARRDSCKYMNTIFLTGLLSKKEQAASLNYLFEVEGKQYKALAKPVKKGKLLALIQTGIAESIADEAADKNKERAALEMLKRERAEAAAAATKSDRVEEDSVEELAPSSEPLTL